jgi:hypothetical protein
VDVFDIFVIIVCLLFSWSEQSIHFIENKYVNRKLEKGGICVKFNIILLQIKQLVGLNTKLSQRMDLSSTNK